MSLPFVTVQMNGVELDALLDSGAARTQLRDRSGLIVSRCAKRGSAGASGMSTSFVGTSTVSCRLGDVEVGTVEVDVVPMDLGAAPLE